MRFLYIFFIGISTLTLNAQNSSTFFKYVPTIDSTTPEWASEMYKEDANFYKVIFEYEKFYDQNPFEKNIHTQNFKYWLRQIEGKISESGTIKIPSPAEEKNKIARIRAKEEAESKASNWKSIGPFQTYRNGTNTPVSWHANVYCIDQSLSNPDMLVCGTESGGVFLSTNKGEEWDLISRKAEFSNGMTAVKINPKDDDNILVGGNNRIYRTTNGGDNWTEVLFVDGSPNEIKYDPEDKTHVFCSTSNGLFESVNGGRAWTQILTQACWDIDFQPGNSDVIYVLMSNAQSASTAFFKSENNGESWRVINEGWYSPQVSAEANEAGGKIAVSADDPNRVYACLIGNSKTGDNGWIGIYRSDDAGESWYLPSGQIGGPYQDMNVMPWSAASYGSGYHQGYYNFDCEASPNDADRIWFGTIRLSESLDGGYSYTAIGAANSQRLSDIHADIQGIEVIGEDVWVISDGGINHSTDDLNSHVARNYGLIGSNFWGYGQGWNEDVYVGGKYHNGNSAYYESYGKGNTHNVGGVEESTGYINPLNNRLAYFNEYWAGGVKKRLISDKLGGSADVQATYALIPNESYVESSSSGYYFDYTYADHIYAGKDSVIYKSTNGGNSFEVYHDFALTGNVYSLELSRNNPDVMYAIFQPGGGYWDWCEIHKTEDGGETWSKLTDVPANNRWRLEMTINDADENEIWVSANNGDNDSKIYRSMNGGDSWENMTTEMLADEGIKDICYAGGRNGHLYALSRTGFFYYDEEDQDWVSYKNGLPFVTNGFKIAPFYRDSKIRIATNGRGIWEANMLQPAEVVAQPITFSDTVRCKRDTVHFDSYSILDQEAASFNWEFTPEPMYINSVSVRNPIVVFGAEGNYTVKLTVDDGMGNIDSKEIEDMVVVTDGCSVEALSGSALATFGSGDYVQLPTFDVRTNVMTMSAWVKPNGLQPDYSGVVMNDDDAAGLNFRGGNNTLGYHWPGGQWYWDSGLQVQPDEWSHVVLVADQETMTLYLNGVPSVHEISLSEVDIKTLKIGSYKGWESRNFVGEIDEVRIWDRALTQDEIRLMRHLTLDQAQIDADEDLLAYYQLGGEHNQALDAVGLKHGVLTNNASKVVSSAPIGPGNSYKINVTELGEYNFDGTGVAFEIDSEDELPDEDIVVSWINQLPHNAPELNDLNGMATYWIINNYGEKRYPDVARLLLNDFTSNPINDQNASSAYLFWREPNDFQDNWEPLCSPVEVGSGSGGDYAFELSTCSVMSYGQYYVFDACLESRLISQNLTGDEMKSIRANRSIRADNTLYPNAESTYEAGNSIDLLEEFEVQKGAQFEAKIGGCQN